MEHELRLLSSTHPHLNEGTRSGHRDRETARNAITSLTPHGKYVHGGVATARSRLVARTAVTTRVGYAVPGVVVTCQAAPALLAPLQAIVGVLAAAGFLAALHDKKENTRSNSLELLSMTKQKQQGGEAKSIYCHRWRDSSEFRDPDAVVVHNSNTCLPGLGYIEQTRATTTTTTNGKHGVRYGKRTVQPQSQTTQPTPPQNSVSVCCAKERKKPYRRGQRRGRQIVLKQAVTLVVIVAAKVALGLLGRLEFVQVEGVVAAAHGAVVAGTRVVTFFRPQCAQFCVIDAGAATPTPVPVKLVQQGNGKIYVGGGREAVCVRCNCGPITYRFE